MNGIYKLDNQNFLELEGVQLSRASCANVCEKKPFSFIHLVIHLFNKHASNYLLIRLPCLLCMLHIF